jgi:hypothetical protein
MLREASVDIGSGRPSLNVHNQSSFALVIMNIATVEWMIMIMRRTKFANSASLKFRLCRPTFRRWIPSEFDSVRF